MLAEAPKAIGAAGGGKKTGPRGTFTEPRDAPSTLADMGIDKKLSARSQELAAMPESDALPACRAGVEAGTADCCQGEISRA